MNQLLGYTTEVLLGYTTDVHFFPDIVRIRTKRKNIGEELIYEGSDMNEVNEISARLRAELGWV